MDPSPSQLATRLRADCSACRGICCVIPGFTSSAQFAITKPPGHPCPNLASDNRCSIHEHLRVRGFSGCTVYDCFGAGQQVCQQTLPQADWRAGSADLDALTTAFLNVRGLHELAWYVSDLLEREGCELLRAELQSELDRLFGHAGGSLDQLEALDRPAIWDSAVALVTRGSAAARGLPEPAEPASQPGPVAGRAGSRGGARKGKDGHRRSRSAAGLPSDLVGADLRGWRLRGADLRGANLAGADLGGALLDGAQLDEAILDGAALTQTQLAGASLIGVRARGTDMHRADLAGAHLDRADLATASLRGATAIGADLRGASLPVTDLLGTDLRGARLHGADLSQSLFLTNEQAAAAHADSSARLPDRVVRPPHWGVGG